MQQLEHEILEWNLNLESGKWNLRYLTNEILD